MRWLVRLSICLSQSVSQIVVLSIKPSRAYHHASNMQRIAFWGQRSPWNSNQQLQKQAPNRRVVRKISNFRPVGYLENSIHDRDTDITEDWYEVIRALSNCGIADHLARRSTAIRRAPICKFRVAFPIPLERFQFVYIWQVPGCGQHDPERGVVTWSMFTFWDFVLSLEQLGLFHIQ